MADSLINLLQARTVLVRTGKSIGTGALIAPQMILTCAHVVRQAEDTIDSIEVLLPDLTQPGHFLWTEKAHKLYLSKRYKESGDVENNADENADIVRTTEFPDVAVIEIKPEKTVFLDFPKVDPAPGDLHNKQFLAFGFQQRDRELQRNVPQAISLRYAGEQVDGTLRKLIFTDGLIKHGMSGAPLMERESGSIVGIVHKTRSPNDSLGAYIIPLQAIWDVFEKWETAGTNRLYSRLKSPAHKQVVKAQYRKEYPRFPLLRKYGIRLFILPALLFLLLWWILFHFGSIGNSGVTSLILVVLSVLGTLLGDWLGEGVRLESEKLRTRVGKLLFGNLFLTVFGVVTFTLWAFVSSIWVYGNVNFDEKTIVLNQGKAFRKSVEKNLTPTGITRFIHFTLPFREDSVALAPEGMTQKKFVTTSFSRKEFYYPKSFELEPVFIVRFDPKYPRRKQMDKYRIEFEVERLVGGKTEIVYDSVVTPEKTTGALFIGRTLDSKERESIWEQELREDPSIQNVETIARFMEVWKNAKRFPDIDLNRNDRINVRVVRIKNDSVFNKQSYSIKGDVLDRLLEIRINQ